MNNSIQPSNKASLNASFSILILFAVLTFVLSLFPRNHILNTIVFEPHMLLPILSSIFLVVVFFLVAYLSIRSYLSSGASTLLYMGLGALSLGTGSFASGWMMSPYGPNVSVTVFNVSALVASLFHVIGTIMYALNRPAVADQRSRRNRLILGGVGIVMFVLLLSVAAIKGLTPTFLVQGVGPTTIRQALLMTTILLFLISAVSIMVFFLEIRTRFLYWYSLGLAMFALGLGIVYMATSAGSLMSWIGRFSQYVAGTYFLFASVSALRLSKTQGTRLAETISDMFQRSEQKVSMIYRNMTDGYFELDDQWRFTVINDRALELLQKTREDVIGKSLFDVQLREKDSIVTENFRTALNEKKPVHFELESLRNPDNWLEVHAYPLDKGLSVYSQDITERKRAEARLAKTNQRIADILNSIQDGLYTLDRNWRFVYASKSYAARTGKEPDDLIGKNVWELFPKRVGTVYEANLRAAMDKAEIRRFEGRGEYTRAYYNMAVFPSEEGITVLATDITQAKELEAIVKEQEHFLSSIVETSPAIIYVYDMETRSNVYSNDGIQRILGYSGEEVKEMGSELFASMIHPDDLQEAVDFQSKIASAADYEILESEQRAKHKDGSYRVLHTYERPFLRNADGSLKQKIGWAVDVTDRKNMEEELRRSRDQLETRIQERTKELSIAYEELQEETTKYKEMEEKLRQSQKMEAIGTLAGGIAHDFNNILGGMMGFVELALEDTEGLPHVQKSLTRVLQAARRAKDLVKQILTFSRKADYQRSPVSITPVVKETIKLLRASIPATIDIGFSSTAQSDTVVASPTEIQQIILNLATNAFMAMEEKGGILEITLSDAFYPYGTDSESSSGEFLQISIKDTGVGMTPEVAQKAFDPFFTTREPGKGTGMGLAVVYGIVRNLDGEITVVSAPGEGSTFRIFLPKTKAQINMEQNTPSQSIGGKERILYVEDEEMLNDWGKTVLERLGYEVSAFRKPLEALQTFSQNPMNFDILVTDQAMPKLAGSELASEIRNLRADIPIILCTGYQNPIPPEKAAEIGINKIIAKPLRKYEFAAAVRKALDQKKTGNNVS